jgi:hypothetical protein
MAGKGQSEHPERVNGTKVGYCPHCDEGHD